MTGVMRRARNALRRPGLSWLLDTFYFVRGVAFLGRRFNCPCCGWSLRSFTAQHGIIARSTDGYCPRCDAKARHRRIWLYLWESTDLATADVRLLEIAPWRSFARRFQTMPNIDYSSVDLEKNGPYVTDIGDATALPYSDGSFDAVICVHVLEHVDDDGAGMREIVRVVDDEGWALITVPLKLDGPTDEDPTVTDPVERRERFGEPSHVRYYGIDIVDRLSAAGLDAEVHRADAVPDIERRRHGLRTDENIFMCRPRATNGQASDGT
jgi:SAM-dependent methyltransferase